MGEAVVAKFGGGDSLVGDANSEMTDSVSGRGVVGDDAASWWVVVESGSCEAGK